MRVVVARASMAVSWVVRRRSERGGIRRRFAAFEDSRRALVHIRLTFRIGLCEREAVGVVR